uniref:Rad4 beta-hairpin domain-containing protein n=1 Tax=Anopheles dirus TaxID=7168 RepID=A0A182NFV1_9DIPT
MWKYPITMSDTFMSESEDEAGDFSASEDEWLPGKSDGKPSRNRRDPSASDSDDSDESDALSEGAGANVGNQKGIKLVHKKSTVRKSHAKGFGELKRANNNATRNRPHQDSDSSGDEHLVDPTKLDLNSQFFDAVQPNPSSRNTAPDEAPPMFDCNAGLGKLSDSSDEEKESPGTSNANQNGKSVTGKKLITKINETSQAYVNFQNFTNTLERAKSQLERVTTNEQRQHQSSGTALNISHLLALGETSTSTAVVTKPAPSKQRKGTKHSADSDSDWEEVEEGADVAGPSVGARETVQITLQPELAAQRKRKKKCTEIDVEACITRMINKEKRDAQLVLHKVTVIMGIAHGNCTNSVLNHPALLAIGNALIPSERCYPKGRTNLQYFEQIMSFYREIVDLKDRRMFVNSWKRLSLEESLRLQLLSQMANCKRDYILLFIILLRSIGVQCRMVMSLQVVPKVIPNSELIRVVPASGKVKVSEDAKKPVGSDHDYDKGKKKSTTSTRKRKSPPVEIPQLDGADDREKPNRKRSKPDETMETLKSVSISPRKTRKQRANEMETASKREKKVTPDDPEEKKIIPKISLAKTQEKDSKDNKPGSSKMVRRDYNQKKLEQNSQLSEKSSTVRQKSVSKSPDKASSMKDATKNASKSSPGKSLPAKVPAIIPTPGKKVVKIERFNPKTRRLLDNRVLSTDDESTPKRPYGKQNLWIEAYAEEEERWIPLDVTRGSIQCVDELVQHASSPMLYVLAWNNDGSIKDVTARYCADYLTVAIKLRIMQQWMDNVLCAFRGDRTTRDITEDRELSRILEERPLPRTITEYKNHPYFALKRHLLKFEAIYPPDAPTLGFTSGKEPVYARECVHTLHAREVWLKQARTVKLYETPYKVVSGRPKYDRSSGQMLPSQPLELFGHWQTEEYEPPTAEDGIVPRNAYGNVELFKPCMLPKRTVHLRSLNRICKKLHIDCAQAVTGFDFHGGSSHPVYDGFVVCEEFRDVVVDAWHQEQEIEEQRAREKYEKRVYGNWKRLIKGLLIRRKLQHKYNFDNLNQ